MGIPWLKYPDTGRQSKWSNGALIFCMHHICQYLVSISVMVSKSTKYLYPSWYLYLPIIASPISTRRYLMRFSYGPRIPGNNLIIVYFFVLWSTCYIRPEHIACGREGCQWWAHLSQTSRRHRHHCWPWITRWCRAKHRQLFNAAKRQKYLF